MVAGYEYVKEIEQTGSPNGQPSSKSIIEDCGLLTLKEYVDLVEEESERIAQRVKLEKEKKRMEMAEMIKALREGKEIDFF